MGCMMIFRMAVSYLFVVINYMYSTSLFLPIALTNQNSPLFNLVGYEVPSDVAAAFGEAHPQRCLNYLFNLKVLALVLCNLVFIVLFISIIFLCVMIAH